MFSLEAQIVYYDIITPETIQIYVNIYVEEGVGEKRNLPILSFLLFYGNVAVGRNMSPATINPKFIEFFVEITSKLAN